MEFLNKVFSFFASIEGELFYNSHYLVAVVIVLYMLAYERARTKGKETLYLIIAFSIMLARLLFIHFLLIRAHFLLIPHPKPVFPVIDSWINTLSLIFLAWAFLYPQAKEKAWFHKYFFLNIFLLALYPAIHFLLVSISTCFFPGILLKPMFPGSSFFFIDDLVYNLWQMVIMSFTILYLRPRESPGVIIKIFLGLLFIIQMAHFLNLVFGQGEINFLINIERILPILASFSLVLAIYHNIRLRLKQTQKEVEEWNIELEKKVNERTQELEKRNKELARAEHLASLGKLAAGLAHEVKNPLNSIEINLGLLRRYVERDTVKGKSEMLDILSLVNGEINRLDYLIQEFLTFARPQKIRPVEKNVKQFIQQILALVQAEAVKKNINIMTIFPGDNITACFDEALMKQVFLNIIINAFESMDKGGELNISTGLSGGMVSFRISDSGIGIKEEIFCQIFEPFFTTKDNGTGLGLSIAQRIVEGHGGSINVESIWGKGTIFTVRLPLS